jgi:hypothetical protein
VFSILQSSLTIVTCQSFNNSKTSLKQDYSAPSMGGVVGTISFDVANHAWPLDSSVRENCFVICYTSSASRRNLLVSQSSPTNHMLKALVGAGVLSALRTVRTVTQEQWICKSTLQSFQDLSFTDLSPPTCRVVRPEKEFLSSTRDQRYFFPAAATRPLKTGLLTSMFT